MNDIVIMVIGFIATTLTTISTFPQTVKTFKTKQTGDISLPTYALLNIGICIWFVYGIMLNQLPIIIGNLISLCFCLPILIMVIINKLKDKNKTKFLEEKKK